jgi:hypothetical protein
VGVTTLFGMFKYVVERGTEHAKDLCPVVQRGSAPPPPFCHSDGTYNSVVGFAHSLCESELSECQKDEASGGAAQAAKGAKAHRKKTKQEKRKRTRTPWQNHDRSH